MSKLQRLEWKPGQPNPWRLGQKAIVAVVNADGAVAGEWYCNGVTGPGVLWLLPPAGPSEAHCVQDPAFIRTHAGATWGAGEPQEVRMRKLAALEGALSDLIDRVPVEGYEVEDYERISKEMTARTGSVPEPMAVHAQIVKRKLIKPNKFTKKLDPVTNELHRAIVDAVGEREIAAEAAVAKSGKGKARFSGAEAEPSTALLKMMMEQNTALKAQNEMLLARFEKMEAGNADQSGAAGGGVQGAGDGAGSTAGRKSARRNAKSGDGGADQPA